MSTGSLPIRLAIKCSSVARADDPVAIALDLAADAAAGLRDPEPIRNTGEEVSNEDIMKGYKVDTDTYIEVSKDELENIALESTRTIDINEFVPKSDIDPRYLIRPYYLVPDGKVGHDAFAVIRETIRNMDMVAIGRVVLTSGSTSSL